jgi:hypothetical protein
MIMPLAPAPSWTFPVLLISLFSILGALPCHAQTSFGVNFTPAHIPDSTDSDSVQALAESAAIGNHISYIWEWGGDEEKGFSDASQITKAARLLNLKVFLQITPTGLGAPSVPPDLVPAGFGDPAVRQRFIEDAKRLAGLEPEYLVLATEINLLYHLNRPEFDQFRTLYQEAYRAVKDVSPATKIGVSYHMDMFFGFAQEGLLSLMTPRDFVAFTAYPAWLVYKGMYKTVADIPVSWFGKIRIFISGPVIFSEIAWPTGGFGNLDDQKAFVARLPELMRDVKPELITWAMLHDVQHFYTSLLNNAQIQVLLGLSVDAQELFDELNNMGLLFWDGPPKPSWYAGLGLSFPSLAK